MWHEIGLLIQDATVAFKYYLLHLGHDKLAGRPVAPDHPVPL
jgi:hypothetical protein